MRTMSDEADHSEFADTFVTAASPQLSPVRESSPEPPFGLSTPPRRSQDISKLEFQTPSPPRNMPELPAPPSSSEDEDRQEPTPGRVSLLADFTAAKTPRPPGAWAPTPTPAARIDRPDFDTPRAGPSVQAPAPQPQDETPVPTPMRADNMSALPTPAPPGAWQLTPTGSMRRKSILKVRFDVDPNTSGESMPAVPIVGPGTGTPNPAAENMSDLFPRLPALGRKDETQPETKEQAADKGKEKEKADRRERSSSPPTPRARRSKSPRGIRILDAFGNETVDDTPVASAEASAKSEDVAPPGQLVQSSTPRSRGGVRIVDAMGREIVEPAEPVKEEDVSDERPLTRQESLARLRKAVAQMAEDLGESDE